MSSHKKANNKDQPPSYDYDTNATATTGGGIANADTVSVTDNLIYSELGSNESAVINPAILEANLVLGNNWRVTGYEDVTNS